MKKLKRPRRWFWRQIADSMIGGHSWSRQRKAWLVLNELRASQKVIVLLSQCLGELRDTSSTNERIAHLLVTLTDQQQAMNSRMRRIEDELLPALCNRVVDAVEHSAPDDDGQPPHIY